MKTKITINTSLKVGDELKKAMIRGYGYVESGFLMGNIVPNGEWSREEAIIPALFSFTGCPLVAFKSDTFTNPWEGSLGKYSCTRIVSNDLFTATAKTICHGLEGGEVKMDLDIVLKGHIPKLDSIKSPFIEEMNKTGKNSMNGAFKFKFLTEVGDLDCVAETSYKIPSELSENVIYRTVTINVVPKANGVINSTEQINMFINHEAAYKDLNERLNALS